MIGAATLGVVTDKIGRKAMYMIDLCIFVVFSAFCVFAWNVWSLIAFRFLLGVGVGADYPISSSYIAEFMPSRVRGKMLAGAFSFQALGSVGGALTGLLVLSMAPDISSWRLMLGAGIIPAVLVMFLRHNAPESPRWLMSQGRMKEAGDVIFALTGRQVCAVRPDDVVDKASAKPQRSWRLLLSPQYLRRTLLALVPWFLLDIALYAVGTFTPSVIARLSNEKSLHATTFAHNLIHQDIVATEGAIFLDLFLVIGFVCSIFLVEKVGRMRLQMFGFTGMTVGLLILSWAGALPHGDQSFIFVFLGFAIFNLLVNMGPNATTYLVAAELFPTDLRATAHGLAAAAGKVGAVIGIFFLPVSIATFGLSSTMAVVAGVGFLGFLVTWMFGIETAGASLEQLSAEPANPTVKLIVT